MPTKTTSRNRVEIKDRYIGESKNQFRHGYGVYKYDNKFFRYEGQWVDGLKHGHGKLVLGDGGYYEGKFEHGEIQGHGYRVFGLSGTTYSGQFHQGQIHGQGLLKKINGEQYEGTWVYGKKEGEGIYTDAEGGVYEGGFHDNLRHGEGRQVYSNGDQYDGEWVLGKRHGHGLQRCSDGTIYDGQWRGDVYHGEGSISHSSGVTYTGLWVNGRPACEPVRLQHVCEGGEQWLTVEQGKQFGLQLQCVHANGEPVTLESGRCFKVSAAIKKGEPSPRLSKRRSKMALQSSPSKDKTTFIVTPFGYSAVSYSLLQVPSKEELRIDSEPVIKEITFEQPGEVTQSPSDLAVKNDCLTATSSTNVEFLAKPPSQAGRPRSGSLHPGLLSQDTRSLLMGRKLDTVGSEETKIQQKDEEFLDTLIQPFPIRMTDGKASFNDLYIPPPPLPDISHIVTPAVSKTDSQVIKEGSSESKSRSGSRLLESPSHRSSPRASPSRMSSVISSTAKLKKNSEKIKAEKERLLNPKREKYALPGTYVLIVSDVTEPPFLGTHLPDLFVEVKVVTQRSSKEHSMDKLIRSKSKLKTASRVAI